MTALGIAVLAVGTYLFRVVSPLLRRRMTLSNRTRRIFGAAAAVLLCALAVTSALFDGHGLAGPARPIGVLVGGALALRRAPFLVAVVAAAATTALLRLAGAA